MATTWLSVAQRFSLVIVVHLGLAAAGIHYAAGSLKFSRPAAWLAAVSYALSCPIVFQHSNLIYLCSASWLGFALGAILRGLNAPASQTVRSCVWFAAACSLMVLAGDPHTAVNTFIVAGLASLWQTVSNLWRVPAEKRPNAPPALGNRPAILHLASGRHVDCHHRHGHSMDPGPALAQHSQRLSARLDTVTNTAPEVEAVFSSAEAPVPRIYDFSLSPWHVATGVWPTLGGNYLPLNSRWFSAISGEGRMWVPSLYGGCLPGLLAFGSLFIQRTANTQLAAGTGAVQPTRCLWQLFTDMAHPRIVERHRSWPAIAVASARSGQQRVLAANETGSRLRRLSLPSQMERVVLRGMVFAGRLAVGPLRGQLLQAAAQSSRICCCSGCRRWASAWPSRCGSLQRPATASNSITGWRARPRTPGSVLP